MSRFLAPLLWALCIFYLSSQSVLPNTGVSWPYFDKVEHASAYALLCYLCIRSRIVLNNASYNIIASFLLVCLYGLSDEMHQLYVPGRTFDPIDWMADVCGALFVALKLNIRA